MRVFAFSLFGVIVLLGVIGALSTPAASPPPPCSKARACGAPPMAPPRMVSATPGFWRSPALGYTLNYAPDGWRLDRESQTGIQLLDRQTDTLVILDGSSASQAAPALLLSKEVQRLQAKILGLSADSSRANVILGPQLAQRPASAVVLRGTIDTAQGPGGPVAVIVLAGGDATTSLTATVVTGETRGKARRVALRDVDVLLATLRLAADQGI